MVVLVVAAASLLVAVDITRPTAAPTLAPLVVPTEDAQSGRIHNVRGTVVLIETGDVPRISAFKNGQCWGQDAWSDFMQDLQVVLTDSDGRTLSTGKLWSGAGTEARCAFDFELIRVDDGVDTYAVQVGSHPKVYFTHQEMVASGWSVRVEYK